MTSKVCSRCETSYVRMQGVPYAKKDYGYCSVRCLELDKQPCPGCGAVVARRPDEPLYAFAKRRYCTQPCSATHISSSLKSAETRALMSKSAQHRSPEHLAKIVASRRQFDATEEGRQSRLRGARKCKEWRKNNPEAVVAMTRAQTETRRERGSNAIISEKRRAFFKTPEGEAVKERYRQLYTGKKRPPRVTQKMLESLQRFWDSPEGMALRKQCSLRMTNGLPRAKRFGPNWRQKAAKIRKRDEVCQICSKTKEEAGQVLDVHHIYPRPLFGYIPGQNENHLWCDHPDNLIALCRACHVNIGNGVSIIPPESQGRADLLWEGFTS